MRQSIRFTLLSAAMLATAFAGVARAENISATKVSIKDNADVAKRQFQAISGDAGIAYTDADSPGTKGAWIHIYSATDDQCVQLPAGSEWSDSGKAWKYKGATKNQAQVADGKLLLKLKSGVTISLADNGSQGAVNVQAVFGDAGSRFCMKCSSPTKDDAKGFSAMNCAAAACDAEPSACPPVAPPTTTTLPPPTTTTVPPTPGVVRGALVPTNGRFNYNLVLGVPGANAACNTSFAGTHACTYAELQSAVGDGSMAGLKDTANNAVTSFWAIDPLRSAFDQCTTSVAWDYQTAHTGHKADVVTLNNVTGTLNALQTSQPCGLTHSVGCCQ